MFGARVGFAYVGHRSTNKCEPEGRILDQVSVMLQSMSALNIEIWFFYFYFISEKALKVCDFPHWTAILTRLELAPEYWRNLATSPSFQGQKMNKCVWRIHDDIIKVWNFNDPHNVGLHESDNRCVLITSP